MNEDKLYLCKRCQEYLPIESFYRSVSLKKSKWCKICTSNYEKEKYYKYKKERCCGSTQISPQPNVYKDEKQKNCTFEFLQLCNWKFNEQKGIWFKEGIKDKNGIFINIKPYKPAKASEKITKDVIQLTKEGKTTKELVKIFKVSESTINKIKRDEGLSNRRNRNSG